MLTAAQWTYVKTQCLNVGSVGPTGPSGPSGPSGPAGSNGISYGSGPIGQSGPSGPSGRRGPNGNHGKNAPDRNAEISFPRTRSYAITANGTIPIYSNDKYHTILLNATVSGPTIRLDPAEIQRAGASSDEFFWVTFKNTSIHDITVDARTFASSAQDIFMSNGSSSPIVIRGNPASNQPGSSVVLYYDNNPVVFTGVNGRFVFI